jgi:tetratricopeptide (TPR) repeat protein
MRILLGVYQTTRRYPQALECAHEVERLARAVRDEPTQAMALDVQGDLYLALGQSSEALQHYERSLDLFRQLGNVEAQFVVKQDIAKLYRTSGQWEKAVRWLSVCLQEEERAENWRGQARIVYDLACLHIHRGELSSAGSYLQRSMGLFRQAEDRAGADLVGRTLMGLSILMHREATANWLTFGDIARGSSRLKDEEEE